MIFTNLFMIGIAAAPPATDASAQKAGASLDPRVPIPARVVDVVVDVPWAAPDGVVRGKGGDCPDFSVLCPMVYDPVICSDGNIYFNQCAATYWGCAGGCEPLGIDMLTDLDGVMSIEESPLNEDNASRAKCPDFSILCPMVYDPVICADGKVYFNQCAAEAWGCTSGCVPYNGAITAGPYVPPGPHGGPCQGYDVLCPSVFDPVLCADGKVYANACIAMYYGCTGDCVPLGAPPAVVAPIIDAPAIESATPAAPLAPTAENVTATPK